VRCERIDGLPMVLRDSSEDSMSSKKQPVTIALDPPDLERIKAVAERERSSASTVIRRAVAEWLPLEAAEQVAA
jgi:Ribbon-helix-helix protein, copG family